MSYLLALDQGTSSSRAIVYDERGTILIIAADRKQARVIMRYIMGLLRGAVQLLGGNARLPQANMALEGR